MEEQILASLDEIKFLLYVILSVIVLGVIANWVRAGVSLKNLVKRELDDAFIEEASSMYEEGKYTQLIKYCEEHLEKKKNHAHALWNIAKAYYQMDELEKSKQYFERVAKSEPSWEEGHINPYLKKIKEKIDENC